MTALRSPAPVAELGRIVFAATVLLATGVGAALLSSEQDWKPIELIALLTLTAIAVNRASVRMGPMRFSAEGTMLVLAMVLAGPAPATAVAVLVTVFDGGYRGRAQAQLWDAATYALCSFAGASIFGILLDHQWVDPRGASLPLLVLALAVVLDAVNFASIALYKHLLHGATDRASLVSTFMPMFPWVVVSGGLAAGAVHAYYTLGIGAVVALAALLLSSRLLVSSVAKAEQRAQQIEVITADRDRLRLEAAGAEERERRRIGEALHDDAMQTLLAARQDVIDAIGGDETALASAHAGLCDSVAKLRGILGALHLPELAEAELVGAIEALLADVQRRSGLSINLRIDAEHVGGDSALAYAIVRELVVNAARHARATTLRVRLWRTASALGIEVVDDGVGIREEDAERAGRSGHMGLQLTRRRVRERQGRMVVESQEGGTSVSVWLPLRA